MSILLSSVNLSSYLDWLEDFRLYLVSFWPDIYTMSAELAPEKIWEQAHSVYLRGWVVLSRQPFYIQILVLLVVFMTLLFLTFRTYMKLTNGVCKSKARLEGKTVVVTGANSGIGLETARDLAGRGARVILACRNMDRGREAASNIVASVQDQSKDNASERVVVRKLDLSCSRSVREFCSDFLATEARLDVLVLNAGIALNKKYMTEEGHELHMASNHFGHFLLANLLVPLMVETARLNKDSKSGRIVIVSSLAHWFDNLELDNLNAERYYDASHIYANTKLANLLFARELSRRVSGSNVTVNALHPGAVQTGLFRHLALLGEVIHFAMGQIFKSSKEGAQTSIYLSVSEEVEGKTGEYYSDCGVAYSSKKSKDIDLAKKLWDKSVEVMQMEHHEEVPDTHNTRNS